MQNPFPPSRVLVCDQIPYRFEISPDDTYVDIYTESERNAIIEKYKTPNLFNGSCARLDRIVNGVAYLSPVMFYDFLCCNIVGIHNKDDLAYPKLKKYLDMYGPLDSFDKVLKVKELPNIIGVSTLLHDINGDYLLVERNTSVSVGSGLFAATSSGSLDVTDFTNVNPIIGCGMRELREELNLQVNLSIQGLVIPIQKMQPIALLTGMVSKSWRQILTGMKQAEDYAKENTRVLIVPYNKLLEMISLYSFTDASSFQIFFEAHGDKAAWSKVANTTIKATDYYA
ncbi:MAG: hypothetical protein IKL53_01710 [Lachnospiraceae bacterium]|nr:hypothetical protein [Lachnospiraceae bacterium]